MPRKLRELRAALRRAGPLPIRQTGSHQTWSHTAVPDVMIRLAGNDGQDAKPYQERDVARAVSLANERRVISNE